MQSFTSSAMFYLTVPELKAEAAAEGDAFYARQVRISGALHKHSIVVAGGSLMFVLRQWVSKSQQAAKPLLLDAEPAALSNQPGSLDELRAQLARDLEHYGE